jgi:D-serine dehydratase
MANPAPATCAADIDDPLLGPWLKGYPTAAEPLRRSQLARQGWRLADGHLPLPVAVLKASALAHNLAWMQAFAHDRGLDLAPHGKTTMSPQLFRRQIQAGAWGITFATVFQLRLGVLAGVRRALIANQVQTAPDLAGLARLLAQTEGLRVAFLVDSIDAVAPDRGLAGHAASATGLRGAAGDRRRRRPHRRARRPQAVDSGARAACQPGRAAGGHRVLRRPGGDRRRRHRPCATADALMARVQAVAADCDAQGLFETDEVIVSAGGSALFDLVAARMRPTLSRPVRGVLRSGCYITHDHGHYRRLVHRVAQRCGCADELRPALEVWTTVQSVPEPGLALLTGGRRDLSFDIELPHPLALARAARVHPLPDDGRWHIRGLNDQHAHLRFDAAGALQPQRRRPRRAGHLAPLHHLRQVALDAGGGRRLPHRRRGHPPLLTGPRAGRGPQPGASSAMQGPWAACSTRASGSWLRASGHAGHRRQRPRRPA